MYESAGDPILDHDWNDVLMLFYARNVDSAEHWKRKAEGGLRVGLAWGSHGDAWVGLAWGQVSVETMMLLSVP